MLEIKELSKSFGEHRILDKASMTVPDGSVIGLYGKSGCGKSTLAKLICGVYPPDAGEIYLDGERLCSPTEKYDRGRGVRVQMVYQQPYSALDFNQKLGRGFYELIRYHSFAPDRKAADGLIERALAQVGLDTDILSHLPYQISGGEAQRVAIARCLMFKPRLLIMDEATAMLDVSTQANVIALVRRVMAQSNGSVLLISHDLELVEYISDRIYTLSECKLTEVKG